MKKLLKKMKTIDYRHYICAAITMVFLLLAVFHFRYGFGRILESLVDIKNSALYYLNDLFELDWKIDVSVNDFTKQPIKLFLNLPNSWEDLKVLMSAYFNLLFTKSNFIAYVNRLGNFLYYFLKIMMLLMPFILILVIVVKLRTKENNNYNKDSKPLKFWKKIIENKIYIPIKNWIIKFVCFVKDNPTYYKLWLFIWLYNFNIITIFIEFIAYYLYFVISFDFLSLYIQLIKLLVDLSVLVNFVPTFIWICFGLFVFHKIRVHIGYKNLNHMEMRDRGFINERDKAVMFVGTMGKGKTTLATDFAISTEIMFRDKAFEKILENDLKFPDFPWINLENCLKKAIKDKKVYNLASCKRFIQNKQNQFNKRKCRKNIFDYDYNRYGMSYDDKLSIHDIWEVIENYSQLYFIYIIQSSLLISNYSIRVDNVLEDVGNFPIWNAELFRKNSRYAEAYSRHAHILDFDMLRLGMKVIKDNKKANVFEFGIINITEIGKERLNALDLQGIKKTDPVANQKNDLFNYLIKLIRHSATIDNFCFAMILLDEQRVQSLSADVRELCEIINIDKRSKMKLAMPFFALEDIVLNWAINKFIGRYYDYRFRRGDNTLLMYLYHNLIAKLNKFLKGIYNTFGYNKLDLSFESGTLDGEVRKGKYYIMFIKVFRKRFSSNCYSDFFDEKALRSDIGVDDLEEFKTEKASLEELLKENSYFIADIVKAFDYKVVN